MLSLVCFEPVFPDTESAIKGTFSRYAFSISFYDMLNNFYFVFGDTKIEFVMYLKNHPDAGPFFSNRSKMRTMAIFIMSAALPCIGAFIAFRSAYPRTMLFLELMSGNIRLRPLIVSTYPFSRAICMLLSIYSFIWGMSRNIRLSVLWLQIEVC